MQSEFVNKDTTPHTATSGKGVDDPNVSKMFDTSIVAPETSTKISTADLNAGEYPFFCKIHPIHDSKTHCAVDDLQREVLTLSTFQN